jgi:hypothetical protein
MILPALDSPLCAHRQQDRASELRATRCLVRHSRLIKTHLICFVVEVKETDFCTLRYLAA